MKTIAIIQARMGSRRLPGKVLKDLAGRPVLGWIARAGSAIPGVSKVIVATSVMPDDDAVADWCAAEGVECFRGSESDVLSRYAEISRRDSPDVVLRLTADCPLLDPDVCAQVLAMLHATDADYVTNAKPRRWPDGTDCEAIRCSALLEADRRAVSAFDREHVTPYLLGNRRLFRAESLPCPIPGLGPQRWTLDTAEDFERLQQLVRHLPTADRPPTYVETLMAAQAIGAYRPIPAPRPLPVDDGDVAVVEGNETHHRDYGVSQALLRRAVRTVPLGTQTFSKAYTSFPLGHAPLFLTHGLGGRVWDVDGNGYVDLINGLLPVVLGYCDADVDEAVQRQLMQGISFSLATELEMELAERLVEIIPCAEMVRFGKNGTDATSAAIRLARAFTGRDHIAVCGYHGWQDWYIGSTTRKLGVPEAVQGLTQTFPYNDVDALRSLLASRPEGFAAVIMEPMAAVEPLPGYLASVKEAAHQHGALLVFDEIISGFRFALGGAQALFGVTPDLCSLGKAMGNGLPISAIAGRADVMARMEDVFISGTFGGEALSLAAAIAVIDKMRREPVIETLWSKGDVLANAVRVAISERGLEDVIGVKGLAPWSLLNFQPHPKASALAVKTLLQKTMLANGVLMGASHNVSYAHSEADFAAVLDAYAVALDTVAAALDSPNFEDAMGCPPIEPVFKVR